MTALQRPAMLSTQRRYAAVFCEFCHHFTRPVKIKPIRPRKKKQGEQAHFQRQPQTIGLNGNRLASGILPRLIDKNSLDVVDRVQKLLHGRGPLAHIGMQSIHDRPRQAWIHVGTAIQ